MTLGKVDAPIGIGDDYFERFGVSHEALAKVLSAAMARGADDCDLFFEHASSTAVVLSDGIVNRAFTGVDLGMGIRVVVGDQVGYAYTEDLDVGAMIDAAKIAAEIAQGTRAIAPVALTPRRYADRYPVGRRWDAVGIEERIPLIRGWESAAFARDPRIEKVQVSLSDSERVLQVVRPDGRLCVDYQPMTTAFVACTAVDGDVRESGAYNVSSRSDMTFYQDAERCERLVDKAVDRTLFLLTAGKPPAGELPVVMAAGASGILLHEAIGHGLEADFNRKRVSIYADRIGQQVAPDTVTIVDDGTLDHARGAINVDDEGNAAENTTLIQNGVLTGYLHDEISARHFGVPSTGSGRRESFRHAPMPRMRATYMLAGPHEPEEIIRSVKKGIYCETFANGQVQIGAGDFAFYMRQGYLIEDGKLTQPIKDVNIIGNGPAALEQIEMVGNDLKLDEGGWTCGKEGQSVPVSQGQPTILVSNLTVGGIGA